MLTLYYSPGSCSLAAHVALQETGVEFEVKRVVLAKGEHLTEAYRKVNPRTRVPALDIGGEVLTENVAILPFIAGSFPDARLLPGDPLGDARCMSLLGFLSSTVHITYAQVFVPNRFAADAAVQEEVKATGRKRLPELYAEIDGLLAGRDWYAGDYSICDPYLMVFYRWGARLEYPMKDYRNWTRHTDRMQERPAVRAVLEREGVPAV